MSHDCISHSKTSSHLSCVPHAGIKAINSKLCILCTVMRTQEMGSGLCCASCSLRLRLLVTAIRSPG